jgi:hypothetical protein
MVLNTKRGIGRICLTLMVAWVPLVLLYPFYLRRQYHDAVNERADVFYEACLQEAGRTYDEASRSLDEASRALGDVNVVGARRDRVYRALSLLDEAGRIRDEAGRAKELSVTQCPEAKDRLVMEVFPPGLNTYQWFIGPRSGRILSFGQRLDQTTLAFLKADLHGWNKLATPSIILPASIVFPAAIVLPPLFVYFLLICGVGLVGWIVRGFTSHRPTIHIDT